MSKVALITASSAGLGAAIAKALASDMRVVINYSSSRQRAESVLRELEQISPSHAEGKRHLALQADVSKRLEIVRLVDETVAAMGRLDVVVSNVGWTRLADFNDLDANVNEDDWDRCFNVNVKAHLFLMHAAKPYLEASEGAFISTASVAGVKPSGSSVAYAVTKAAQIHLAKSLAIIMSPKVRVNSVSPGIILTVSKRISAS